MNLFVKATPGASKSEIIGWQETPTSGRVLCVRIAAPAIEGKANAALCKFLAKSLGIPKSQVILERGQNSRIKKILLPDNVILPQ